MRKSLSILTALTLLSACETLEYDARSGELWDPNVASANDGIYINLPFADELIRVNAAGISVVDLDGAIPNRLVESPDGSQVLVFAYWEECKVDDSDIVYPEDCDDLVSNSVLSIVSDATVTSEVEIPSHLNTVSFSNDGSTVAYLDYVQVVTFRWMDLPIWVKSLSCRYRWRRVGICRLLPKTSALQSRQPSGCDESITGCSVDLDTFERTLEAPLTLDADQAINPSAQS